jgi:hypothetical protein
MDFTDRSGMVCQPTDRSLQVVDERADLDRRRKGNGHMIAALDPVADLFSEGPTSG